MQKSNIFVLPVIFNTFPIQLNIALCKYVFSVIEEKSEYVGNCSYQK